VLHHVIARGIERRVIFRSDADRKDFVARLGAGVTVLERLGITAHELLVRGGAGNAQA
jgi:hypothetical protein